MDIHVLPITGDGSTHALSAVPLFAKWVKFFVPSGNSGDLRIGGPGDTVDNSSGYTILKGSTQDLPAVAEPTTYYDLSKIQYHLANTDTMRVLYGVG